MVPPVPPVTDDAERLAAVRAVLPALAAGIYLNSGTSGPLPAETGAVLTQMADYELDVGRGHTDGFMDFLDRMAEARASIAALLTADIDDIGLTHGATDGMNIGLFGIDWAPGDRAVTTRMEHPGGSGPLVVLRERRGVDVEFLDIGHGGDHDQVLAAFDAAIDERTRAVVISHVLWSTGAVMPVRAIADLAHDRGALVIVDGAQSAGAIPIDLAATGADVYAIPGQKWLMGPEGTGAVAVPAAVRPRIAPTYAGHYTFERLTADGDAAPWSTARKYEGTGFHRPSVVGLARSVGWLSMFVGLDWIYERGARLAGWAHDRLSAIRGVEVVTPRAHMATLVTFKVAGWTPDELKAELGARVFAVTRTLPLVNGLRISVGFFNSEDELERFCAAVELLAAHTPETVPARRTLTLLGQG
ncbi:MAG: aminotransferase class V-fold PLP-dependent enzyme [Candidatus Limnocylindrales bacterium]